MSFWEKLSGAPKSTHAATGSRKTRRIQGFMAAVPKEDVTAMSTKNLVDYRNAAVQRTVAQRRLHLIELSIDGYNEDPRELYQIPEVVAWMKHANQSHKDIGFWLTPGSFFLLLLCCFPNSWRRRPDGNIEVTLDPGQVMQEFQVGWMASAMVLTQLGVPAKKLEIISKEAAQKLADGIHGQRLGRDYVVVS